MSEDIVTLDVRESLKSGREPFGVIMQAAARLAVGQKLLLIAPFEPVPLYGVMAQRGFECHATERGDGAWEVLFSRSGEATQPAASNPAPSK
jgi:uncharacterized protein (DUF2249 family)